MERTSGLIPLARLPALARSRKGPEARRYLRERAKVFARGRPVEATPRRRDGVRELTVTSIRQPRQDRCSGETYVPCLRLSGRWLEQHGFGIHARVVVQVEPGRLIVTLKSEMGRP